MTGTETQVSEVAGELQRVLAKVMSVLRHTGKTATAGDLTLAQLSILLTLLDQGPMRMTELAAHERVRTPTTTVAIRRLEKLGLVKRSRDPSDLRAVLVEITPEVWPSTATRWPPGRLTWPNCWPSSARTNSGHSPRPSRRWSASPSSAQPSQSSTAAAVHDCCMLPSGSPVNGS